jgi:peptidoglycan/LPS O-acetylase OafA/YrhL
MSRGPSNGHPRSWQRVDGIDVLRGLAIFFVLMNHVNIRLWLAKVPYTHGIPRQLVSSLVWNGQFGVQMFFAVSGFLITSTSLRRWGSLSQISVVDFYKLRFARIAPLLLLLLAVLSAFHFADVGGFVVSAKTGGLGRALVAALTFHVNLLEARRGYLPAPWDILWSLSVEETFYFFFPLICLLFGRGRLLIAVLCGFILLGPFGRTLFTHGNDIWQEKSYLGGMDAIAMGCLTALLIWGTRLSSRAFRAIGAAGIALLIFMLCFSRSAYAWGLGTTGLDMTVLGVATCLVIVAASQSQWRAPRILSPLLDLGQRSYEVYLTHMFVVLALFGLFVKLGKPMPGVPLLFVVTVIVAASLGDAVAKFYSEPMNRWLRRRWKDGPERLGSVIAEPLEVQSTLGTADRIP